MKEKFIEDEKKNMLKMEKKGKLEIDFLIGNKIKNELLKEKNEIKDIIMKEKEENKQLNLIKIQKENDEIKKIKEQKRKSEYERINYEKYEK